MAGMYGLGYGAGAAGAGLGQGMVQGMMLQPQLQAQGLQNQQRQMSVDEQKAMQQEYALAPQVLADPQAKNPDGSLNANFLTAQMPRLAPQLLGGLGMYNYRQAMGEGVQQKTELAKQAALNNLQARVGIAIGNETDPTKRMQTLNTFTPEFQQLSGGKDPQWESIATNSPAYFQALAKGNTDPNKNLHDDAVMEDLKYKAGIQTQRDKAKFGFLTAMEGLKTGDKAGLQDQMGKIHQNLAQFHIDHPSNADLLFLDNQVRAGVDPRDAYIDMQGIKSTAQGKDAASRAEAALAKADNASVSATGRPLPADVRNRMQKSLVQEFGGIAPPVAPAPRAPASTSPQNPAAPATSKTPATKPAGPVKSDDLL